MTVSWGFPDGSVVKNPPANAGDTGDVGSIPSQGTKIPHASWQKTKRKTEAIL